MFLVNSHKSLAIVPGFLLGYRGDAMMPEYSRYMATLPYFVVANIVCALTSGYALLHGGDSAVFISFAIFMSIFSARLLTQRLVRVSFAAARSGATSAPLLVRLNTCMVGASLVMMGVGYLRMTGGVESLLLEVFGIAMIGLSALCLLALRRGHSSQC